MKYYTENEKKEFIKKINELRKEMPVKTACKKAGVSDCSYYSWRRKYSSNDSAADVEIHEERIDPTLNIDKLKEKTKKNTLVSKITQETEKIIVDLKKEYPYYGVVRISQHLRRFECIKISPSKVLKVLEKNKINVSDFYKARQIKKVTRFERERVNDLWALDIMPYRLKNGEKFSFIGIIDDYSRYLMKHGVFENAKSSNIIKILQESVETYGLPKEVLTDCGGQFHSWNGSTEFEELLANYGIKHIKTRPHNPACNGKIESFHRNLQKELLWRKYMNNTQQAKDEIEKYIEYYNNDRPHQGIGGLTPADRYHGISKEIEKHILNPADNTGKIYAVIRIKNNVFRIENKNDKIILFKENKIKAEWDSKEGIDKAFKDLAKGLALISDI
jgi:transposase InsO family protein